MHPKIKFALRQNWFYYPILIYYKNEITKVFYKIHSEKSLKIDIY